MPKQAARRRTQHQRGSLVSGASAVVVACALCLRGRDAASVQIADLLVAGRAVGPLSRCLTLRLHGGGVQRDGECL